MLEKSIFKQVLDDSEIQTVKLNEKILNGLYNVHILTEKHYFWQMLIVQ